MNSIKVLAAALLLAACTAEMPQPGRTPGESAEGTGGEAMTRLNVSLPASVPTRTALGEKQDGKYPTVWKEGDCLQLNGYSSLPLPAEDAGGSSAPFVFRDGLASPFNLLYPASGEKDLVVFPSTQHYVKGGFDPQAAAMWGSSDSYSGITLHHFSSLVRISITSQTARVLKSITLTALGDEPLSGSFRAGTDADGFLDGSLTAENATPSTVLSFGEEGIALGAGETTVAYIAVPLGNYSKGFRAVVKSAAYEYRQLRFFSEGRSLQGGKVLEFPDKTFDELAAIWEYYVSADGTGNGLDEATPMSVAAMTALLNDSGSDRLDGATFHFTEGTHTITEPIVLPGKEIYSNNVSYTITGDKKATLDGGGTSQIFLMNADASHVTVKDLSLTNGSSTASGGLVCVSDKGAAFRNCSFTGTTTTGKGGAVRIENASKGSANFQDCVFSGNKASDGGVIIITNAGTEGTFTRCSFKGNSATGGGGVAFAGNGTLNFTGCVFGGSEGDGNSAASSGGVILANNSNSAEVNVTGGEASYNTAANGGFIYSNKTNTFRLDGVSVHHNTATTEGGAVLVPNGAWSPVFYINGCSFYENTAKQNGYVMYLNTSTAGNFATLCVNNSTFYNSAEMTGTNASVVCNKGKSVILNSTFYGKTSKWGTFALGCHKNYDDHYGCLLLNSIFVNATADKPSIYQTGSNYWAEARNCISSSSVSNSQFTETDGVSTVPALKWDGSLFTWNGTTTLKHMTADDIRAVLGNDNYSAAGPFLIWLESLGALEKDQQGRSRSGYIWAGSYQQQ